MLTPSPEAITHLATRRSHPAKFFAGPTPDRAALQKILTLALRVPDHGKLEPWRLIVITREDMARLANLAEARARILGYDDEKIAKGRDQFDLGQVAVVVISAPVAGHKVPVCEQILSAGALCMNILHAATASGWAANWLSGWPAHDPDFAATAFGSKAAEAGSAAGTVPETAPETAPETVAGILHIGTAGAAAPDRPRPSLEARVQWGLAPSQLESHSGTAP
jgi:nitroreductase